MPFPRPPQQEDPFSFPPIEGGDILKPGIPERPTTTTQEPLAGGSNALSNIQEYLSSLGLGADAPSILSDFGVAAEDINRGVYYFAVA